MSSGCNGSPNAVQLSQQTHHETGRMFHENGGNGVEGVVCSMPVRQGPAQSVSPGYADGPVSGSSQRTRLILGDHLGRPRAQFG